MKRLSKFLSVVLTASFVLPLMSGITVLASGDIPVNGSYFPDAGFRNVVSTYDTDGNGVLSEAERNAVINIHCENMNISSIQGVEQFPQIQGLWCLGNHISSMNLSGNPELIGVWCSDNDLTSLDLTGCPKLEWLYCYDCNLQSLNVANNPNLAYLECNANPGLQTLNVSGNPQLEHLFCSDCGLTSLNLANNPRLCELDAFNNNLTSINLTKNPLLKRLDIWNNPNLGNVNISGLRSLEYYNCAKTGATSLDMSGNPNLMYLICGYNSGLTSLNISGNPRLADLRVDCDWSLPSLNISGNTQLYYLQAFGLRISSLDISNCPHLMKTYSQGTYADESNLGAVHSYTIEYGGSDEIFNDLTHCLVVDNGVNIVTNGPQGNNHRNDSYIDNNDGHDASAGFVTRGEAIQRLYELAGSPTAGGSCRFSDAAGSPYANAVTWGQANNICFGYPNVCSDTFCPNELISREDFALMAHRFAGYMGFGTAFDYGRTDWFDDFAIIDYYCWGAFTWAVQFGVVSPVGNNCYPHGRVTRDELMAGSDRIFHLSEAASYSANVNGNGGASASIDVGKVGGFIDRLYNVVLQRDSDPSGKEHWIDMLRNGSTGGDIARGFFFSQEFLGRQLTDEQYLEILYQTFFDRPSDGGGREYWLGRMRSGLSRSEVYSGFVNSSEWAGLCSGFGIAP